MSTRQTYIRNTYNCRVIKEPISQLWGRLQEATPNLSEQERTPYFRRLCGVSQASVSRWRTGQNNLRLAHAIMISNATGVCVQYLMAGTGPKRWNLRNPDIEHLAEILDALSETDKNDVLQYARFRAGGS